MHQSQPSPERRPGRFSGVRARSTLIAAVVVAVALIAGAAVTLFMLHRANNDAMYQSTGRQAFQIATAINNHGPAGVDPDDLAPGAGVDIIQVIDAAHRVVARSPGAPSVPLTTTVPSPPDSYRYLDDVVVPHTSDEFCATVFGAEYRDQYFTVIALERASPIRHSEFITAILFAIEFPIMVAIAALGVYLLVGKALRPVSQITAQVTEISQTELNSRVPVPQSDDEIHDLAVTMNDMMSRLESGRDAQLRFVGDASHELRSPLTTLVGILDLADDTDSEIDVATTRAILLPEARRMQSMIEDLLLLAKADEHGIRLRRESIDLDDLVGAEVARLRTLGTARVHSRVVPARIVGDPDSLTRALRNLTDNAVRHTKSAVWLTMRTTGDTTTVTVADDGPGVPREHRSRIFDRFARIETDRRQQGGAGLGLAIAAEIVRAHGGDLRVTDSDTGGAAFVLSLPVDENDETVSRSHDSGQLSGTQDTQHTTPELPQTPVPQTPATQTPSAQASDKR